MGLDTGKETGVCELREANIQNAVRIALSRYGVVFRTNAGTFWQGTRVFSKEFNQPVLINLRKVDGLPAGFSDLLFVGKNQVAFVETKNDAGRLRDDQKRFGALMSELGHKFGVARSAEDAVALIGGGRDGAD